MKKIIIALVVLFSANVFAQIHDPVKWSTSVEKISDTEYTLISTATIESGDRCDVTCRLQPAVQFLLLAPQIA